MFTELKYVASLVASCYIDFTDCIVAICFTLYSVCALISKVAVIIRYEL